MSLLDELVRIWRELSASPLVWLTLTLVVYQGAVWLYQRLRCCPVLHPVLTAIAALVAILLLSRTPYETYFEGARFIHFLLGPATVALAVPLYAYIGRLRQMALPISAALIVGCLVAIASSAGLAALLGASPATVISLAPKSATTPIAMGVAEKIGGMPSLTAVLVILTGIIGGVSAKAVLDLLRVRDPAVRGFSMGLAAHGIGTARAYEMSEETGAFSGLGMGLNGALTAILVPLLAALLGLI